MTLETIVRSILACAMEDGLVSPMETLDDPDPQSRTDEELGGCVMVLQQGLKLMPGSAVPAPHRPHITARRELPRQS